MERIQTRRFRDLIRIPLRREETSGQIQNFLVGLCILFWSRNTSGSHECATDRCWKEGFPAGPVTFTLVVSWSHWVVVAHRGASMSSPEALPSHSF
ncbi:hypothetical protein AMECASPLE_009750 [Ameca splendens]|uniref:Uncharacterized protein n=1 Tax=Ameca splendens TaxID=208324 RepID=A0ABV0YZR6_9TELE